MEKFYLHHPDVYLVLNVVESHCHEFTIRRSLHSTGETAGEAEQIPYQPGIDYSLQRRDVYSHIPQHIHGESLILDILASS